jgi:hypothetical protein
MQSSHIGSSRPWQTELGIDRPATGVTGTHVFYECQQFRPKPIIKLLSFLSVGTKQQSRLKYSHSLMSIPFGRLVLDDVNLKNLNDIVQLEVVAHSEVLPKIVS